MKTNILTLAITLAIALAFMGSCQKTQNASDFEYESNDEGTITIIGYKGTAKDVKIPQEINGVAVTSIFDFSFERKGLTSVVIPNSVTFIGSQAFEGNKLTSVIIPYSVWLAGDAFDDDVEIIVK